MTDLEIKLGESDAFRRSQVIALSDALAAAHGENAILRSRLKALEPTSLSPAVVEEPSEK